MIRLSLQGGDAQEAFGRRLARVLSPPCMVWLEGDLGAGKTTLVRGVLRGMGHQGRVPSPTYTLVESYSLGDVRVHHLDLYRLADPEELEYLGLTDLLDEHSILLVEWPGRGIGILPSADLRININHAGQGRELQLVPETKHGSEIAEGLARDAQRVCEN